MAKENTSAASSAEGKLKALQAAMTKIEKDFGKGAIMRIFYTRQPKVIEFG